MLVQQLSYHEWQRTCLLSVYLLFASNLAHTQARGSYAKILSISSAEYAISDFSHHLTWLRKAPVRYGVTTDKGASFAVCEGGKSKPLNDA